MLNITTSKIFKKIEKKFNISQDTIDKAVKRISNNHEKILDDFAQAYLASRWKNYFLKQKKIDFRRVELVEQRKSPTETVYFFRLKKGRLKIKL